MRGVVALRSIKDLLARLLLGIKRSRSRDLAGSGSGGGSSVSDGESSRVGVGDGGVVLLVVPVGLVDAGVVVLVLGVTMRSSLARLVVVNMGRVAVRSGLTRRVVVLVVRVSVSLVAVRNDGRLSGSRGVGRRETGSTGSSKSAEESAALIEEWRSGSRVMDEWVHSRLTERWPVSDCACCPEWP